MTDLFEITEILKSFHNLEEETLVKLLEGKMLITGSPNVYRKLSNTYPKLKIYYTKAMEDGEELIYLLDLENPMKILTYGDEIEDICIPLTINYTSPQYYYNPATMEGNVTCSVGIIRKDGIPL